MLFTRCPDCDTTFRVTDDALKRANGQVRCGRCASVFNAYAERREEPGEPITDAPSKRALADTPAEELKADAAAVPGDPTQSSATAVAQSTRAEPAAPAEAAAPAESAPPDPPLQLIAPAARDEPREARAEPPMDAFAELSVAAIVAQLEQGAVNDDAEEHSLLDLDAAHDAAMPPAQVEAVLETEPLGDWRHVSRETVRRSRRLSVGVAAALVTLGLQLLNHYRAELVKQPSVGSLVQSAYAALGVVVLPRWDVRHYQILDWVATAEPSSGEIGSLRITARIQNVGSEYQPYPDVNLRLKDRWEAAVGGRVFAPAEYLAATPRKLMAPGETARAQLELVDPGPDAYGFDLDVCVEVETHVLSCRNDKVFL
jgi:predicted Zn finger-like uncharacterized protein